MSERLIHLLRARSADGAADAELLARWADRRDEAAFELLVRRHAEPVWRTCRAVAGEGAEDAFQATFLALSRRAGAVRGNVPGWLHRVARHASLRARRAAGVSRSGWGADQPDRLTPAARHEPADFAPLHEELARLPDAYRLPVLLCHLHGRTQAEAAKELALPLGTVATRVRRGCDKLKVALTRRGFEPALGFGPPLVVPASLLSATLGIGLGATAAPPAVHTLATGAVSAMSRTKLKLFTLAALVGTAVGGGALVARHPAADPPPKPAPALAEKVGAKPADYFDRKESMSRMKQVMLSLHSFHDATVDKFPRDITGPDGKPLLSWRVAVLPHLEQELLFGMFKLDEPWDGPTNKPLLKHVPRVYRSPGAGPGLTRVKAFRGPHAFLDPVKPLSFPDFTDGTSNTIGVADTGAAVEWTKPGDLDVAADKPLPDLAGPFTDGYPVGFCDGSVRWLRPGIPEATLRAMITRDGGEVVGFEDGLPPPAKRPLTDREKKQAAQWRRLLEQNRDYNRWSAEQRVALTLAAAKLGPIPPPAEPADDDLFALEQAVNDSLKRQQADSAESARLLELLKAKDPAAAAKIEKEFEDRMRAMRDKQRQEWEKQQKKK